MMTTAVGAIQEIYSASVQSVLPDTVLRKALIRKGTILQIGDTPFCVDDAPVYALAIGKAAGEMMAVVEGILGDSLVAGIAVVKTRDDDGSLKSTVVTGSHPVPDQRSLDAGEQVLAFAAAVPAGALVLCLISGGGSALVESLRPGVSLDDLQHVTRNLLQGGASIHELNAVRARLSYTKAGGLLSALSHATVMNLIISDVIGDDLATIASGPTVLPQEGISAEVVLKTYGVDFTLPEAVATTLEDTPASHIVGSLSIAIDAAVERAETLGFQPVVLGRGFSGEARHAAATLAAILADTASGRTSFGPGTCFIGGGETTVTVRGGGRGGRNTESALSAALVLSDMPGVAAGFLATDGDDAETGVAGGIVTGTTVSRRERQSAREALDINDSFSFLERVGATWGKGPTGTNVNDLFIGIVS
jgi:glycerate 2-kinase